MLKILIEIKWALIFIIALLLWTYFEKVIGWHGPLIEQHYKFTNLFALIAVAIYVFALLEKRNRYYNGSISYRKAVKSGIILTAIILIFTPLVQLIIHTVISPEYFDNMINYSVNYGEMNQKEAENYFSLESYIKQSLIFTPIQGLLTTLLVALFIKKRK